MKRLISFVDIKQLEKEYTRLIDNISRDNSDSSEGILLADERDNNNNLTFFVQPGGMLVEYDDNQLFTDPRPGEQGWYSDSLRWIGTGKRLRSFKMTRTASTKYMPLKWFCSKSGLSYSLNARKLANRIFYSIIVESEYDSSTLYDGEDYNDAFELFCELSIAIKGITFAEELAKAKEKLLNSSMSIIEDIPQDMTVKTKPLFLGDSDLAIC